MYTLYYESIGPASDQIQYSAISVIVCFVWFFLFCSVFYSLPIKSKCCSGTDAVHHPQSN